MPERQKLARSVREEAAREHRFWKRNVLWTLLVFAALFVYSLVVGPKIAVEASQEDICLTMEDKTVYTVKFSDIADVKLVENPDYGSCITGSDKHQTKSGRWLNEQWGEYTVCTYNSSSSCIVAQTGEGTVVFNLASEVDTEQLYHTVFSAIGNT